MTDARSAYEDEVAAAQLAFSMTMVDAYQKCRDECQAAWYRYQIRTGILEAPEILDLQGEGASERQTRSGESSQHGEQSHVPYIGGHDQNRLSEKLAVQRAIGDQLASALPDSGGCRT